MRQKNYLKGEG